MSRLTANSLFLIKTSNLIGCLKHFAPETTIFLFNWFQIPFKYSCHSSIRAGISWFLNKAPFRIHVLVNKSLKIVFIKTPRNISFIKNSNDYWQHPELSFQSSIHLKYLLSPYGLKNFQISQAQVNIKEFAFNTYINNH